MVGQLSREELDAALGQSDHVRAVHIPCGAVSSNDVIVFRIRLLEMTGRFGREL